MYINEKEMMLMLCQALGIEGTIAQGDEHFSFIETLTAWHVIVYESTNIY